MLRAVDLGAPHPDLGIAVDPLHSCRWFRLDDAGTVSRSDDAGSTWNVVFQDTARGTAPVGLPMSPCTAALCPGQTEPFNATTLAVTGNDEAVLGEDANGDGFGSSPDGGGRWQLGGGAIAGQAVELLRFAGGTPAVGYAVTGDRVAGTGNDGSVEPPAASGLFRTDDGGAHWTAATLPLGAVGPNPAWSNDPAPRGWVVGSMAIDPRDPTHLWLVGALPVTTGGLAPASRLALFESSDAGSTWSQTATLSDSTNVRPQLLALRSARHALRLALFDAGLNGGGPLLVSDSDGQSWHSVDVPADVCFSQGYQPAMAQSTVDADKVLLIAFTSCQTWPTAQALLSTDGLDTVREVAMPLTSPDPNHADSPYNTFSVDINPIQPGDDGSFYVSMTTTCLDTHGGAECPPFGATWRSVWRFDDLAVGAPTQAQAAPAARVAPEVALCPVPAQTNQPYNGSLAYDGQDLLYTNYGETGPAAYEGVIHKMDPVTCKDSGTITVHFSPQDLRTVQTQAQHGETDDGIHPWIDDMTYDARRNILWFGLTSNRYNGTDSHDGQTSLYAFNGVADGPDALFTLTVDHVSGGADDATAHLAFLNGCNGLAAYDYGTDSLWTCDVTRGPQPPTPTSYASPGRLTPAGSPLPTCFGVLPPAVGWTMGSPGFLYGHDENDTDIDIINERTCDITASYRHPLIAEPVNEDEELACDPLTFPGQRGGPRPAVIWLRDAGQQDVTAWGIPGSYCPLPSFTHYLGPSIAASGSSVQLCAHVTTHFLEGSKPVADGLPVTFTIDGRSVGSGDTVAGTACTASLPVTVPKGPHTVLARFAGDDRYLPSQDAGVLTVTSPLALAPHLSSPAGAGLVPPPAPPANAPEPGPQPINQFSQQVQAEAQSQSQAQAQGNAQVQAGPALQRQRRTQVATQQAENKSSNGYLAARRVGQPATAIAVTGALLVGILAFARAPTAAVARRRPSRHSSRPLRRLSKG